MGLQRFRHVDRAPAAGDNRTMQEWFKTARFGMFIHWAASSQRGWELSWPLVGGVGAILQAGDVSVEEYHRTARTFDPVNFDPRRWARMARRAGMTYGVLTSKHHDGFAMFHSRHTSYSIENTPFKRDIVREYVEAFRAEGLRIGLYFSLIDWHDPDYPAFTESDKPYRWGAWRRGTSEQWDRFVGSMFGQIRELLTNYGRIDLLWFDGGWERTIEEWRSRDLERMVRGLQPEIVINDRLPGCGDYDTPEQAIPASVPSRPWETCMTMNRSWGYNPSDRAYKSVRSLLNTLSEVAGKGGNLLLNVSPTGDGSLPAEQAERLEAIAKWMERNGESIEGTEPGLEPWQFYGPSTRRGDRVYLHLLMRPYDTVAVRGIRLNRFKRAFILGTTQELKVHKRGTVMETMFSADPTGELVIEVPESGMDPLQTVIALDL